MDHYAETHLLYVLLKDASESIVTVIFTLDELEAAFAIVYRCAGF
jgi:hypothetical protein